MGMKTATTQIDLGNNESASVGIVPEGGGFLALTMTASKIFKTYKGAAKWLAARGYAPNGSRLV